MSSLVHERCAMCVGLLGCHSVWHYWLLACHDKGLKCCVSGLPLWGFVRPWFMVVHGCFNRIAGYMYPLATKWGLHLLVLVHDAIGKVRGIKYEDTQVQDTYDNGGSWLQSQPGPLG